MKTLVKTLVFGLSCVVFSLHADPLLYWMVDQSQSGDDAVEFQYARVAYVNGDGVAIDMNTTATDYLTLQDGSGNSYAAVSTGSTPGTSTLATWADFNGMDTTGKTFFIELFNESFERVGQSTGYTYSDLQQNNSILTSSLHIGQMASLTAWAPSVSVPEPTSGLLMLIGGSLLALRRRRKIA